MPNVKDESRKTGHGMLTYDGPTLRAIRESMGVPLRRIARQANMSHGHLSKVERGEHGRPITPAILTAYEKVTGVSLAEAAEALAEQREGVVGRRGKTWQPGQLSDIRRLGFNAAVGALAAGGQIGEPYSRLLDSTGRPTIPIPPRPVDAEQIEHLPAFVTSLDLRHGGGLASQLAKTVLRWAVAMLDLVNVATATGRRVYGAVSAVAGRAAWSAFDTGAHESARSLYRLALYTAVRARDADLRAHLVADAAAQHNHLGYHEDALNLIRLVEGDERISPAVRQVLHTVKARAYATAGHADHCRRNLHLAAQAHADTSPDQPGWLATLHNPAHLAAATGHALATLHRHTGDETDQEQARQHLTTAIAAFDPNTHTRAAALCQAQLADLHLHTGEPDTAETLARRALAALAAVDSARLRRALATIRNTATGQGVLPDLVADLDAAITSPGNLLHGPAGEPNDDHQDQAA